MAYLMPDGSGAQFEVLGFVGAKAGQELQSLVAANALSVGLTLRSGLVALDITIIRAMPLSWSEAKRDQMETCFLEGQLGVGNVVAAVCAGLRGIAYVRVTQIVQLTVRKLWGLEHVVEIDLRYISKEATDV